ncbi:protein wntless homolog A-like [Patiria miniata]|uniref:Protein wntless homolog n=1 Tax=Patiria miniata TaxID=46514 RepID=A0A914AWY0_PATMI|nr:protein wntless homolog A-like [Patiria miniata]
MAGAILENLSTKKLSFFCLCLLLVQIACFLVGGLVAPAPSSAHNILTTKCIDPSFSLQKWFQPHGPHACDKVRDFDEATKRGIFADWIVFSAQVPHRPNTMHRSFQYMLGVLVMDIGYSDEDGKHLAPNAAVTLVVRLGYKDTDDGEFQELVSVNETRKLECVFPFTEDKVGYHYSCEPLPLFELGSVHHKHYLINIRMPITKDKATGALTNTNIGSPEDLHVVIIHQNGGFTTVWMSIKTIMFPIVLLITIWFWRRVKTQGKPSVLLERTIFALAIIMSILNFPMEWLTFWVEVPFMTLLSDIKQGAFYAMLFSFWIIFIGEHLMDQTQRNRLKVYRRQVASIIFTFFCLFIFDVCERGVQLVNPFFSMWNTDKGYRLAMAFIILAGICLCSYCLFLLFMVYQVFKNISMRRATLPHMAKARRLHYEGLIYRFRFFMIFTVLTAIFTVIFFIMSQVLEGHQKAGESISSVQYTSGFYTGVYGMWNIYVVAVLVLYAPSHKKTASTSNGEGSEGSHVEFDIDVPSEGRPTDPVVAGSLTEAYQLLSKTATE